MLGVGIITYNRVESLKLCVASVRKYSKKTNRIIVADDGSTDGTQEYCEKEGIELHSGDRVGIAGNKNSALRALKECEGLVLLEDDCRILKGEWVEFFYRAYKRSGEHHFCMSIKPHKRDRIKVLGGYKIRYTLLSNGICMFMSKTVLDECGGFDIRFGIWGHEHTNYSQRICKAGLTQGCFPHLVGTEKFVFYDRNWPTTMKPGEKTKYLAHTRPLLRKINSDPSRQVFVGF